MKIWIKLFIFLDKLKKTLLLKKGPLTISGYVFFGLTFLIYFLSLFPNNNVFFLIKNIFLILIYFLLFTIIFYCEKKLNLTECMISFKSYVAYIFYGTCLIYAYFYTTKIIGFSIFQLIFPTYFFEFTFINYAFLSIVWFAYQKYNKNEERKLKKLLQKCTVMMTLIQTVVSKFSDDGVFCLSILLAAYVYIDYLIEYADNEIEIKKKEGLS